jgi:hypothetical protein
MFNWLKKFLCRKKNNEFIDVVTIIKEEPIHTPKEELRKPICISIWTPKSGEFIPHPRVIVPKAGNQAIHQDVSKFMKHGKQSPIYRKSVKAKIQPEEDN